MAKQIWWLSGIDLELNLGFGKNSWGTATGDPGQRAGVGRKTKHP